MKLNQTILLVALMCVFHSCSDDDENMTNNDPQEISCPSEVSFDEDGTTVTLPILNIGGSTEPKLTFQLKDPSPFDPNKVSRSLSLRLQSGLTVLDIALEINVPDANSCIPIGQYNVNTLNINDGILSFIYAKNGLNQFFAGLGEGEAILEITKCDFDNKLISGRFNGTVVQAFTSNSISITNGVFEDVCLSD